MAAPRSGHSCVALQNVTLVSEDVRMHICYVDESGDAEALRSDLPESPPVFVLVGMTVPNQHSKSLAWDYLKLKKEYNPSLGDCKLSDLIEAEVKGSKLRKDLRKERGSRNVRRRAARYLDATFDLLETHNCQLVGKIIVKQVDAERPPSDRATYSSAIAELAASFQAQLAAAGDDGLMILDARTKVKNAPSTLGITTRRFKTGGDAFPNFVESPVFGHSDTHVHLQIVDIIASAIVFPIACSVYCADHAHWNVHPHARYAEVKERYGRRLQNLEYRYTDSEGNWRGGFQVIDPIERRPTHHLFRD